MISYHLSAHWIYINPFTWDELEWIAYLFIERKLLVPRLNYQYYTSKWYACNHVCLKISLGMFYSRTLDEGAPGVEIPGICVIRITLVDIFQPPPPKKKNIGLNPTSGGGLFFWKIVNGNFNYSSLVWHKSFIYIFCLFTITNTLTDVLYLYFEYVWNVIYVRVSVPKECV